MNEAFATLPMYPYPGLRDAWNALYAAAATVVAPSAPDTPLALDWDVDAHESWVHPRFALSQACGWPLISMLESRVRVVGAFAHRIDGTSSHMYRSVIVARKAQPLTSLAGARAAINSDDSLSGCISLLSAFEVTSGRWPGDVTYTGAHGASIEAVRSQRADVASIDALAWAYLQRLSPQDLDGLVVVGRGPLVPCLPLIVPDSADDALLAAWRSAFAHAVLHPGLTEVCNTLLIDGFVPLDLADYQHALADQTRSS